MIIQPEFHHLQWPTPAEAELMLPLLEPAIATPDVTEKSLALCRLADAKAGLGDWDTAQAFYSQAHDLQPDCVHAHAGLLHLHFKDEPIVRAALNLPLRLRTLYGTRMLVWYAFPDLWAELQIKTFMNRTLGRIAEILFKCDATLTILDVGANVGQSVAEIHARVAVPVLSVEVGTQNYALCTYNSLCLNPRNNVINALVGPEGQHGTIAFAQSFELPDAEKPEWIYAKPAAADDSHALPTVPLTKIVEDNPAFANSKLVKIDAEGWDWSIISASPQFWQRNKPVIFFEHSFEFEPDFAIGQHIASAAIQTLLDCGYTEFLIFDAAGRVMIKIDKDVAARISELNTYMHLTKISDGGMPYMDICAVHGDDQGLADAIYQSCLTPH